jgi:hypothetical protein
VSSCRRSSSPEVSFPSLPLSLFPASPPCAPSPAHEAPLPAPPPAPQSGPRRRPCSAQRVPLPGPLARPLSGPQRCPCLAPVRCRRSLPLARPCPGAAAPALRARPARCGPDAAPWRDVCPQRGPCLGASPSNVTQLPAHAALARVAFKFSLIHVLGTRFVARRSILNSDYLVCCVSRDVSF